MASHHITLETIYPVIIGVDRSPIYPHSTQTYIKSISHWTDQNLILHNADKSNYMLMTRPVGDYSTRLQFNNNNLDRVQSAKLLGVWLTDTMDWELSVV